jgi:ribosomal protein L44E
MILAAMAVLLSSCATREVLAPIDGTVPPGIDLTGNWKIRPEMANDQRRLREAIRRTDGVRNQSRPSNQSVANGKPASTKGGLVYVFLETGTALKVTQTPHALFISFDRSVVEEFRFGEVRMVSVGQVQAQRVTGWRDNALTVETLDKNGMKLTERYQLTDGGNVLQRTITFRSKKLAEETVVQEFTRTD